MEAEDDSGVMQSIQLGDSAKLAVLFEKYHLPLFRFLLHLSGDRTLSEDLVQEVFFRVLKYAHSYDLRQSFRVWLYQAARHAYLDSLRKRRSEFPVEHALGIRSGEPMPEEKFTRKQDLQFLGQALAKLPEAKRAVLVLSRFQGLRYEEIGEILQIEAGAVKVRIYRALRELRETFHELQGEKPV